MEERRAKAGLVVAQLGLRDHQVLPDAGAFRAVVTDQAFQSVQDGSWSVVFPREHRLSRGCPFEIEIRYLQKERDDLGEAADPILEIAFPDGPEVGVPSS